MITSLSNAQMKNIMQLNAKARVRREQDVFVAEGMKMFLEAPPSSVQKVYVSEHFIMKENDGDIIEKYPYEIVKDDVFHKVCDTKTPQGILTVLKQFHYSEKDIYGGENPLLLLLEGVQDPGNLGTMIRTSEGAGVSGIIMDRNTADIYNPKVIRATMGSVYRMPFLYVDDLHACIRRLKEEGICVYASHLSGEELYTQKNYRNKTSFLIGNEGNVLTRETAERADAYIKIPMNGRVESLNAAIAAALLLYEADRQRRM